MRLRAGLFALLALASVVAVVAACGDDEAAPPTELDGSFDGTPPLDDGAPVDGGTDVARPTEKSSCVSYVLALCAKQKECSPSTDEARCAESAEVCPEYFFSVGSTRTIASMLECAAEFSKISCEAWTAGVRPACQTPGTLDAGSPCISPSQCASAHCDGLSVGTKCGTCAATYAADEACSGTGDFGSVVCPMNQRCDPTTKRCAPIVVPTVIGAGAPCTTSPSQTCATGTSCLTASADAGEASGTCSAYPTAGNPCARPLGGAQARCAETAYCTYSSASTLAGTCTSLATVGQPCGFIEPGPTVVYCESALYCKNGQCAPFEAIDAPCVALDACGPSADCRFFAPSSSATCRPSAGAGEPCGSIAYDGGTSSVRCASNVCRPATDGGSTCREVPTLGRGADCSAPTSACHSVLTCKNGSCTPVDYASCVADAGDGG